MPYDPIEDAAQGDELKAKRSEKAKDSREQEKLDIKTQMSTIVGRRVMARLFEVCGNNRTSFTGNSETFFREGQRNVGLVFLADVQSLCPREYIKMLTEHQSANQSNVSARTK